MQRRTRRIFLPTTALILALGLAAPPAATGVPIDGTTLSGALSTTYDPKKDSPELSCESLPQEGLTPVNDGSIGAVTDAFDGGLILSVNGTPYAPGSEGTLVGQRLTTGPQEIDGIRIRTASQAMAKVPALRHLVTLTNTGTTEVTKDIEIGSDLGSDMATVIEGSSDGNMTLDLEDRWIVTSDGAPFDDPVVTHHFYGFGTPRVTTRNLLLVPGADHDEDCVQVDFGVTFAPGQTLHLMFFAGLTAPTDADPIPKAVSTANGSFGSQAKMEKRGLLDGINWRQWKKIANWRLKPPKR